MVETVLYIATSLDGYIARPDGNLDWLSSFPAPETGDYGYTELLNSIEAIIMGRKTYEAIIGFGVDWPYTGIDAYVVTTNKELQIKSPDTFLLSNDTNDFVTKLRRKTKRDIWLVGGGQLITKFINEAILDKMIITVIPKMIGKGIPLFADKLKETNLRIVDIQLFDTGAVNLTYEMAK